MMFAAYLFGAVIAIGMPLRAWQRYRSHAAPAPFARYTLETLVLTGVLTFLLWYHDVQPAAIGLELLPPSRFIRDVAICFLAVVGLDLLIFVRALRQIKSQEAFADTSAPYEGLVVDALAGRAAMEEFVAITIIGAVWEELCFRATVFMLVPYHTKGLLLGIVSGALIFGAQHLRNGPAGMLYSTFFGVFFSLLYLATGNLFAVIIAHAAGNLFTAFQWGPRLAEARQEALRRSIRRAQPVFLG